MATIVHMTSVHSPLDPRIFEKECRSLAAAGHYVSLVAPADADRVRDSVHVVAVPKAKGRLSRMLETTAQVFSAGRRLNADIYHFHDPELIPWALALRALGKQVVYDVHEDYVSSLAQKTYLPAIVRRLLSNSWDLLERFAARAFHVVLAERYYAERFPSGRLVLNYPIASESVISRSAFSSESRDLLYTGNVTEDRGALIHAALAYRRPDYTVHLIGRCPGLLATEMQSVAGAHAERLILHGIDQYVPFSEIERAYASKTWLCGLALFPATHHYMRKELTKFFEYMRAGLPIICSNFPTWRSLIEDQGLGLCVPPNDPAKIDAAIDWLRDHPTEAAAMGEKGRELSRTRYTWNSQASVLLKLYEEILHA